MDVLISILHTHSDDKINVNHKEVFYFSLQMMKLDLSNNKNCIMNGYLAFSNSAFKKVLKAFNGKWLMTMKLFVQSFLN